MKSIANISSKFCFHHRPKGTVVKVRGQGAQLAPLLRFKPLLLMKKCSFMHKMCQIPEPHRRLRPLSPCLTWLHLTTGRTDSQYLAVHIH